jgi:hypothetical protein
VPERFDATYFRRFYSRSASDRRQVAHLATGILGLAAWWQIPIRSVLDVGAGKRYWADWLAEHRPNVHYHGLDVSEYACRRYGHELADLASWSPRRAYDLVVCRSVMQYLDNAAATGAIATLGVACQRLLYFETPTTADFESVVDADTSDLDAHRRSARWYRSRLDRSFTEIGAGLWLSRLSTAPFFELEISRR